MEAEHGNRRGQARLRAGLGAALLASVAGCGGGVEPVAVAEPAAHGGSEGAVAAEGYEVVATYPHDPSAFTQGLLYSEGYLYEGTGRRGESSVRKVEIETGEVLRQTDLPAAFFGEGIAMMGDRLYQLTWLSGVGFVYDRDTLGVLEQFSQFTEGWGLTHDGVHLILSDGSATLYTIDPETMAPVRQVEVRDGGRPVTQINELEFIDGEIYANVWHSDEILRISPRTGEVRGRIDMSGILDSRLRSDPEAVLNGIAYDPEGGRIFVTGKLWPRLFEVRFVRAR